MRSLALAGGAVADVPPHPLPVTEDFHVIVHATTDAVIDGR
jgi:hypothetical protein